MDIEKCNRAVSNIADGFAKCAEDSLSHGKTRLQDSCLPEGYSNIAAGERNISKNVQQDEACSLSDNELEQSFLASDILELSWDKSHALFINENEMKSNHRPDMHTVIRTILLKFSRQYHAFENTVIRTNQNTDDGDDGENTWETFQMRIENERQQVKDMVNELLTNCELVFDGLLHSHEKCTTNTISNNINECRCGRLLRLVDITDVHSSNDKLENRSQSVQTEDIQTGVGLLHYGENETVFNSKSVQTEDIQTGVGLSDYSENETVFNSKSVQTDMVFNHEPSPLVQLGIDGTNFTTCDKMVGTSVGTCDKSIQALQENLTTFTQADNTEHIDKIEASDLKNKSACSCGESLQTVRLSSVTEVKVGDPDVIQEKYKQLQNECEVLQQKVDEVRSDLCCAEVERDLKKEEARYLEEQVLSLRSMSAMKENELVSLRKRYKLLNEAFMNSEELRENLEKETSQLTENMIELECLLTKIKEDNKEKNNHDENQENDKENNDVKKVESFIEKAVLVSRDSFEREKQQKESVEEMLSSVEKERGLLVKENEVLKCGLEEREKEIEELRKERHLTMKQLHVKDDKQHKQEVKELQGIISQHLKTIGILEHEITTMKETFAVSMEKLQNENELLSQEKETNYNLLREVGFQTLEDVIHEYLSLKNGKEETTRELAEHETVVKQLEKAGFATVSDLLDEYHWLKQKNSVTHDKDGDSFVNKTILRSQGVPTDEIDSPLFCSTPQGNSVRNIHVVPRSEFVKLQFQLKSKEEELRHLKEISVPEAFKKFSERTKTLKEERTSLKHENKAVKKWLKTMKENICAITEEDQMASKYSVMLQTQLHEARVILSQQQREIAALKLETTSFIEEKKKLQNIIHKLQEKNTKIVEAQSKTVNELRNNIKKLENLLKTEFQNRTTKENKVAVLEEHYNVTIKELERTKESLNMLKERNSVLDEENCQLKAGVMKCFRQDDINTISILWNDIRRKNTEHVDTIRNKNIVISEKEQELASLSKVNTVLRIELSDIRTKLEKEYRINLQHVEKLRCQNDDMNKLRNGFGVLKRKEDKDREPSEGLVFKLEEKIKALSAQLEQTQQLLTHKQEECHESAIIIEELQRTCATYEFEFEQIRMPGNNTSQNIEFQLNSSNEENALSEERENDLKNFKELTDILQRRLSSKKQVRSDSLTSNVDSVVEESGVNVVDFETYLNQCRFELDEKQHALDLALNENTRVLKEKKELQEMLDNLKEKVARVQETERCNSTKLDTEYKRVEKELKNEIKERESRRMKCVMLEELNKVLNEEMNELKEKVEQIEIDKKENERILNELKFDFIKKFGHEDLQMLKDSWDVLRKNCSDLGVAIEREKEFSLKTTKELTLAKEAKEVLNIELESVKMELEETVRVRTQDNNIILTQNQQMEQNEKTMKNMEALLKEESKKLVNLNNKTQKIISEKDALGLEIQATKKQLSEIQEKYEFSRKVNQELEATCQVYENEFQRISKMNQDMSSASKLFLDFNEKNQSSSPEISPDSPGSNVKEIQDSIHRNMADKMQELQSKVYKLLEALNTSQRLNEDLQQRLHTMEIQLMQYTKDELIVTKNEVDSSLKPPATEHTYTNNIQDVMVKIDEEYTNDTIMVNQENRVDSLSKSPATVEHIYTNNIKDVMVVKANEEYTHVTTMVNQEDEVARVTTLNYFKETIQRLKKDNEVYEEKLTIANKEIQKGNKKIAMLEHIIQESNIKNNLGLFDHGSIKKMIIFDKNKWSTEDNETSVERGGTRKNSVNTNTGEELISLTEKYVNLKAAFDGCQERLGILESKELEENDETVMVTNKVPSYGTMSSYDGEDVWPIFSELSVSVSENEEDNYHAIEVSLELNKNDSGLGNDSMWMEDFDNDDNKQVDEKEREISALRSEINSVKNRVVQRQQEIHRVKTCAFEHTLKLEAALKHCEELVMENNAKLKETELVNYQQQRTIQELEQSIGNLKEEITKLQLSSANEKQHLELFFHDKINLKEMKRLQEINRIKICSSEERRKLEHHINELEHDINKLEIRSEAIESMVAKKTTKFVNEIERLKTGFFEEREVMERIIGELKNDKNKGESLIRQLEEEKRTLILNMEDTAAYSKAEKEITEKVLEENKREINELQKVKWSFEKEIEEYGNSNIVLKKTIQDLENKLRRSWLEIERIKKCCFEEKEQTRGTIKNLENIIRRLEMHDGSLKNKKYSLEQEMGQLETSLFEERQNVVDIEGKYHKAQNETKKMKENNIKIRDELQRVKICSFEEYTKMVDKIKQFGQQNDTLTITTIDLEKDNTNLETQVVKLGKKIKENCNEIGRIKLCSLQERETLNLSIIELTRSEEELKKHGSEVTWTVDKLGSRCTTYESEIARIKMCAFTERMNYQDLIEALKNTNSLLNSEKSRTADNVVNFEKELGKRDCFIANKEKEIEKLVKKNQDLNAEAIKSEMLYKESQKNHDNLKREKEELEIKITSLTVTIETLQRAYEQSQDEDKQNKTRLQELRNLQTKNGDMEKLTTENITLRKQILILEDKTKHLSTKNTELECIITENNERILLLEKDLEAAVKLNISLQDNSGKLEGNESGSSSTANLRKRNRELRSKLAEEKKQREIFEFELKNLNEKVEKLTKRTKELNDQLEGGRKVILELRTERDGLVLDLDSVNKRKKKDLEGYTSKVESLENELKFSRGKEVRTSEVKNTTEALNSANEQLRMLQLRSESTIERYTKETIELQEQLRSQQGRHSSEITRLKTILSSNQSEILELNKSLKALEREIEQKTRELATLEGNFKTMEAEKNSMEQLLKEKSNEGVKWRKEVFDLKAEVDFLRGALNILEKEDLMEK